MYHPTILSARPVRRYRVGRDEAVLLTKIVVDAPIVFRHMLQVAHRNERQPFFYVTLEGSCAAQPAACQGGGLAQDEANPFFLCLFLFEVARPRHANLGVANALVDLAAFERRAVTLVAEHLGAAPVALA